MRSFKTNCVFYCLKYNLYLETLSSTTYKITKKQITKQCITQNDLKEKGEDNQLY